MTYCIGWKTSSHAFLVADSAITSERPLTRQQTRFGEQHPNEDGHTVQELSLKVINYGVAALTYAGDQRLGACAVEVLMLGDWRATAGEVGSWLEYGHLAGPTLGWGMEVPHGKAGTQEIRVSYALRWALRAAEPVRWRTRTCLSTWPASPSA